MEDRLKQYLRAEAGRRSGIGHADCVIMVADWLRQSRGIDPLANWRGQYQSMEQATAFCADKGGRGGLVVAVARVLREAGLPITRNPKPGDVGVLLAFGNLAICAIKTPRGWVMRTDHGLASLPSERVRVLRAWSL